MAKRRFFRAGCFYHIFNRSIAGFRIFADLKNGERFLTALDYYNTVEIKESLSYALSKQNFKMGSLLTPRDKALVKIIAYCIMPNHYHLFVKLLKDDALWKYISDVENSFTRFFNVKFKRKGPLWEGRFKYVIVRTNSQALHLTRYIHLNPTSEGLVKKPEDWKLSSYNEYISDPRVLGEYLTEFEIDSPERYRKFVEDRVDYQARLAKIKKVILE